MSTNLSMYVEADDPVYPSKLAAVQSLVDMSDDGKAVFELVI
jgi:hypothetical protein